MLDKIKEVIKLQNELEDDYGIISISRNYDGDTSRVHMYEMDKFVSFSRGLPVVATHEHSQGLDGALECVKDNIVFFILLNDENIKTYESRNVNE